MKRLIPYRTIGSSPALVAAAGDRALFRRSRCVDANDAARTAILGEAD
jgi:hypothetical protein